ncbi:Bug family tripartite tricarboxylate transporter substrate binding protein [Roseomonas xinghualingensis]|uniref:Bug family tripartite tricarboxylate transporter substrate binding protein n=1 Tax=Roseomonas xinghualingensis TaxID=2986475 RepID=UPI0021F16E38|nr:tripartite tricarboxylate transporter substrate binding protein [Roseomonas sp. SXEYE001]MCV4205899.1 tripartite tricarboxylate transporter substrate binding protein [Roseomonas sp. SXEYE001]
MLASRRRFVGAVMAASALPFSARADANWPNRPIRVVASYAPGGGVDVPTRVVAEPMGRFLGQPLVVENRAGATGSIGAGAVAQAAPDGYTILSDASGQALNPALMPNLPFDYAKAFAPVGRLCTLPQVLVVLPKGPESLRALLNRAREVKGLTYASSGIASGPHLAGAVLSRRADLGLVHVAYRGSAPAMQDVLAGAVDMAFSTTPQAVPLIREGRLRALAVTTRERLPFLPDVPTIAEQGFEGFDVNDWVAVWAPAGTPDPVLVRLNAALNHALADPAIRDRLLNGLGVLPTGGSRQELAEFVAAQRVAMREVVRAENIRLE